jgi:prevent-host-death family protein
MSVGIKELKNRLSHYLQRVRRGESVLVVDRGRVIAELRPVEQPTGDDADALAELAAEGVVTLRSVRPADVSPVRIRGKRRASQIVLEGRR